MKKHFLGALITLTALFALAAGAQAQTGNVVAHIKQDFVVGRKTLPAGTYRISQSFPGGGQAVLTLRGVETGASTFLIPTTYEAPVPQRRKVTLTQVGDVFYLSEVATDLGIYTLAPPQVASRTAKKRGRDTVSSAGAN